MASDEATGPRVYFNSCNDCHVEVHQLRAFLAVAEELHFGRAAERLHIGQAPMSRAIAQLERDLGTQLFVRTTRRVSLSPAGAALVGPATEALEAIHRGEVAVAAAERGEAGLVRIAFSGASTHVLVGRLAKAVREVHPGIDFQLDSAAFANPALDRVIRHETELGLGRWSFVPPEIASRTIAIEQLVIGVRRDHPITAQQSVSFSDLTDEEFVMLPPFPGSVLASELHRLAREASFIPKIAQVAPDSHTIVALVGAGVGVTLTVSSVAENNDHPDVAFIPVRDTHEPILLQLIWRKSEQSPAVLEVLRIAAELLPPPAD